MDFNIDPSLTHQASITVVSSFWYRQFHKTLFHRKNFSNEKFNRTWLQESNKEIAIYLKNLIIPTNLKQHLLNIFPEIGQQIFLWLQFHKCLNLRCIGLSEILVWSHQGTINSKATAEKILKNKNLSIKERFEIASINCIYKELLELWPEYHNHKDHLFWVYFSGYLEVVFWRNHFTDEIREFMLLMVEYPGTCINEFALWIAIKSGNYVFAKYFIQQIESHKLARDIKNLYNRLFVKNLADYSFLASYLLSCLSENDQMEIVKIEPEKNLILFMNWPLQQHFLKLADKLWNSLIPIHFYVVLEELARKVSAYHWGQMYHNLFIEFWNRAPLTHKNYVIDKCMKSSFLSRIFSFDNTDSIVELLLREMNPTMKVELILGYNGRLIINSLLCEYRWTSLKLLIENCITTRNDIDTLNNMYFVDVRPPYIITTNEVLRKFYNYLKNLSERLN